MSLSDVEYWTENPVITWENELNNSETLKKAAACGSAAESLPRTGLLGDLSCCPITAALRFPNRLWAFRPGMWVLDFCQTRWNSICIQRHSSITTDAGSGYHYKTCKEQTTWGVHHTKPYTETWTERKTVARYSKMCPKGYDRRTWDVRQQGTLENIPETRQRHWTFWIDHLPE